MALYHFFVSGNRFETERPSMTGTEIKALAGVREDYQLYFRDDVNTPDRHVRDTQAVDLVLAEPEDAKDDRSVGDAESLELDEVHTYHGHFYAVPNISYRRLKSNP